MIFSFWNTCIAILFPTSCFICKIKGTPLCQRCLSKRPLALDTPYTYSYAYFSFKDPALRACIHALKYYHRKDLAQPLVDATLAAFCRHIPSSESVFIPIPMSQKKKWVRGYNQAEELAKIYSKHLTIPVLSNVLVHRHMKKSQVEVRNRKERLKNKRNAFVVLNTKHIIDKSVILVDDVTTTGATLHVARAVLLKAGAKSVIAISIAH